MTRLPRNRDGKTAVDVDVVLVEQEGREKRVRLTMGQHTAKVRNTDMDEQETEDLITLLTFKLKELRGEL